VPKAKPVRAPKAKPLIPPDRVRCQAEKPNGHSFMTLGGRPGLERCSAKPSWIAKEVHPGKDGRKGSMALCTDCRGVMERQMPGYATFTKIKKDPKSGGG
jgi:hypothetical protein